MTEQKTALLICTAGITTGLLVKNVQNAADERGLDIHVYSAPAIIAEQAIQSQSIDALMIGPQSKYEIARLKDFLTYKAVPYKLISRENYEILDGEAVLEEIIALIGK
ncbi:MULTISPECIES: PTS sugar transporter subunit IIB [Trichococcus]|jgi:PTS system cellobiose-specific IIB component|uniref:Phosphotransferase system eiib component type 2/3 n=3 Tax=Trichococcus TaxID=82802 RepID=A0A383TET3_9LACT|nr:MULTISPECIES: PTS sugar transporter subunit IIB [Trichococcus]OUL07299.1 PTS sugar transporter subunit IIB [Sedimentibacter sp. SX930]TNV69696.1 PTS sugar transporter subunit IIB [Trichococcus shcherbakoviae subsp. psychrophilus]CZQ94619.1 phosphotransferase system eiib component type 2/3 [Trichococcus collinsii]SEA63903.1 PTS system, cellobiose-specific IIB component [Trichococcus collinsii]SYZ77971.1 phosphotransferase system eiib component type 2/3 [Trichococcus shcherbakoviae]